MKNKITLLLSLAFTASLALGVIACGDDDSDGGGGGGGSVTSLPSDLVLSDMTDDQKQTFCEEGEAWAEAQLTEDEQNRLSCWFAVAFEETDDCQATFDECMAEPPQDTSEDDECSVPSCAATVGDYVACQEATLSLVKTIAGSTCDNYQDNIAPLFSGGPAACTEGAIAQCEE